MSEKYKVQDSRALHFITISVVDWIDLFIRRDFKDFVLDSLRFCQEEKGLKIYAWVIMTSHIHLIVSNDQNDLPSVVRDFKTFTSKGLIKLIKTISESRRVWLLKKFAYEADRNVRATNYKLWQDGFHPIELSTNEMMDQKLNYLPNAGRYSLQSG
jgi:putative transposase